MTKRKKTGKRRKRRTFGAEQKAEILRRHIKDKEQVSDLCEEYGIQPSVFYGWQNQLLWKWVSRRSSPLRPDSRRPAVTLNVRAPSFFRVGVFFPANLHVESRSPDVKHVQPSAL